VAQLAFQVVQSLFPGLKTDLVEDAEKTAETVVHLVIAAQSTVVLIAVLTILEMELVIRSDLI
jgi:hypothetical protein